MASNNLMEKGLFLMLTLIVIAYAAPTLVTALNALNLTSVGGTDLTFVVVLVGLVFFVGIAIATYKIILGSAK